MPLLDSWMPHSDMAMPHAIDVAAPPAVVYDALLSTDFSRNPLIALLMGIRVLPAVLTAPAAAWRRYRSGPARPPLPLKALFNLDFALLEQQPPVELVVGLSGRFWTPSGGLVPTDPATFRDLPPPGTARAACSFRLEPLAGDRTRLTTETRVRCADADTLRQFRRYWRIVSPGSALIRWAMLRQIRRQAVDGRR